VFNGLALMIAVAASGQMAQLKARAARRARLRLLALEDEPPPSASNETAAQ
jgi:hypothetical protein